MNEQNGQVQFPQLDEAVEKYVTDLAARNIEATILINDVEALTDNLYMKNVLITDTVDLVQFTQMRLVKESYYSPLEKNRLSTRCIRIYLEHLNKENPSAG